MYVKTWKRGSVCIIEKGRFYKSAERGRWTMSCVFPFCLCLIFYRFSFPWLRKWIRSLTEWWRVDVIDRTNYIFCLSRGDLKEQWRRNAFKFEKNVGQNVSVNYAFLLNYLFLYFEWNASSARHIIGICD